MQYQGQTSSKSQRTCHRRGSTGNFSPNFFLFLFNEEGKGAENFRRKNKLGCCDGKVDRPIKSRVKINFQLLHIILLNFFYRDFCYTSIIFPNPNFWACFSGTFVYEANNVEPCFVFWRDTVKPITSQWQI